MPMEKAAFASRNAAFFCSLDESTLSPTRFTRRENFWVCVEMKIVPASGAHGLRVYQSGEGQVGAMIEGVGATKDTGKKINVHCADFDLFAGLRAAFASRNAA